MNDNEFTIDEDATDVTFTVDTANNAIVLTCNDLSATFRTNDFRYKETIFVAKGHAEVDMNTVKIGFGL